jgi:hypothetical protein
VIGGLEVFLVVWVSAFSFFLWQTDTHHKTIKAPFSFVVTTTNAASPLYIRRHARARKHSHHQQRKTSLINNINKELRRALYIPKETPSPFFYFSPFLLH